MIPNPFAQGPIMMADPITELIVAVILLAVGTGISVGMATGSPLKGLLGFLFPPAAGFLMPKPKLGQGAPTGLQVTVQQSNPPRQIVYGTRVVSGAFLPVTIAGANNEFWYFIVIWSAAGPDGIDSVVDIRFGDEIAVNGTTPISKYAPYLTVEHHLGTDAQTASALLLADVPGAWGATDQLNGLSYTVFKAKYNQDAFSGFSVQGIRAQLRGNVVLDPRTGVTAYSDNPVLCLRHYLLNARESLGVSIADLDDAYNNASANICDELVAVKAGGTRKRYAISAAFLTTEDPGRIADEFRRGMAGSFGLVGWKYRIGAGAWHPPLLPAFTDDDLRGAIQLSIPGRETLANGIKGTFIETTHWQPTNYPPYSSAAALADDGNVRLWATVDFGFVTDPGQAQALAKIELLRKRAQSVLLPLRLKALRNVPADSFQVDHARFGWSGKTFYLDRLEAAEEAGEGDVPVRQINLHGHAETAETYSWVAAVDETTMGTLDTPTLPTPSPTPFVPPGGDPTVRPRVHPGSFVDSNPGAVTGSSTLADGTTSDTTGAWVVVATEDFEVPSGAATLALKITASTIAGSATVKFKSGGPNSGAAIHSGSPPASPDVSHTGGGTYTATFTNPVGNKLSLYAKGEAGPSDQLEVKAAQDITTPLRTGSVT